MMESFAEDVYRFAPETHEECQNWYFELSRHIPRVVEAGKEVHGSSIEDCISAFPSPNCKQCSISEVTCLTVCAVAVPPPTLVTREGILNWMDTYRHFVSEQKRWASYLGKIRAFPELASLNGIIS